MFTILYTVFMASTTYHAAYGGVSTQLIGEYKTVEQCEVIAKQLRTDGYRNWTTARCVQKNF